MSRIMSRIMNENRQFIEKEDIRIKLVCNTYNRGREERENENNVKYI